MFRLLLLFIIPQVATAFDVMYDGAGRIWVRDLSTGDCADWAASPQTYGDFPTTWQPVAQAANNHGWSVFSSDKCVDYVVSSSWFANDRPVFKIPPLLDGIKEGTGTRIPVGSKCGAFVISRGWYDYHEVPGGAAICEVAK